MTKAIRVTIGGKDLTLRGNDEEKIKKSVREVNLQVQHLQQTLREQSTPHCRRRTEIFTPLRILLSPACLLLPIRGSCSCSAACVCIRTCRIRVGFSWLFFTSASVASSGPVPVLASPNPSQLLVRACLCATPVLLTSHSAARPRPLVVVSRDLRWP